MITAIQDTISLSVIIDFSCRPLITFGTIKFYEHKWKANIERAYAQMGIKKKTKT